MATPIAAHSLKVLLMANFMDVAGWLGTIPLKTDTEGGLTRYAQDSEMLFDFTLGYSLDFITLLCMVLWTIAWTLHRRACMFRVCRPDPLVSSTSEQKGHPTDSKAWYRKVLQWVKQFTIIIKVEITYKSTIFLKSSIQCQSKQINVSSYLPITGFMIIKKVIPIFLLIL